MRSESKVTPSLQIPSRFHHVMPGLVQPRPRRHSPCGPLQGDFPPYNHKQGSRGGKNPLFHLNKRWRRKKSSEVRRLHLMLMKIHSEFKDKTSQLETKAEQRSGRLFASEWIRIKPLSLHSLPSATIKLPAQKKTLHLLQLDPQMCVSSASIHA